MEGKQRQQSKSLGDNNLPDFSRYGQRRIQQEINNRDRTFTQALYETKGLTTFERCCKS